MAPTHSHAFCNNRGGVGKTYMVFQAACEAARARPLKKVLVVDFSLYSDISALLMGGTAREKFNSPMKGLQVTVENTTEDNRVEGLIRDLEHAMDTDAAGGDSPVGGSIFGAFFTKKTTAPPSPATIDLTKYLIRPSDHNPAIPPNLYLVPGAGKISWKKTQGSEGEHNQPLWTRKGDQWYPVALKLRDALDALPSDFDAVMFDTDHLAACVLTKLALAVCKSMVLPLSFDDADFNRLFEDVTDNALLTDVMLPMNDAGYLRAKISRVVFSNVSSRENKPSVTECGIGSPFTPIKAVKNQMDVLAQQMLAACDHGDRYMQLFADADASTEPTSGNRSDMFVSTYFTAMKTTPEVAANMSKLRGQPLCTMTTETYTVGELQDSTGKGVLDALKAEVQHLVMGMLPGLGSEAYNQPLQI
uniref:AAA domain-containing protein n=1 Tax=Mantoniella antarctica TaxID=81844 RepID=A0A7S0T0Z3_9CHLO|mmetsp:Transcript_6757/g.16775  ORF Transcript_6757/g.16775 Transcript_6757/m.16775 type:complete len:417 (+) Transcript_6757:253-1503(+)